MWFDVVIIPGQRPADEIGTRGGGRTLDQLVKSQLLYH